MLCVVGFVMETLNECCQADQISDAVMTRFRKPSRDLNLDASLQPVRSL